MACKRLRGALLVTLATGFLLLWISSLDQILSDTPSKVRLPRSSNMSQLPEADNMCDPMHHIMFLKTHKCASSTLQNIFLKYGVVNNLNFALPRDKNYLGNPEPFTAQMIPPDLMPAGGKVDIFAVHSRLNLPENMKVLHDDSVYITVLRDPPSVYESLYFFFRLDEHYKMSLEEFLKQPIEAQRSQPRKHGRFGHDTMLFDLGTDVTTAMTEEEIRKAIDTIDETFDIVLMTEKLDESLVLMKHYLCWQFEDIVYLNKNSRMEAYKKSMSNSMIDKLKELNHGDQLLYDYFLGKHEQNVDAFGRQKMAEQVQILREHIQKFQSQCNIDFDKILAANKIVSSHTKGRTNKYDITAGTGENCKLLMETEMKLMKIMRSRAFSKKKG